jgi:hypothetical protein
VEAVVLLWEVVVLSVIVVVDLGTAVVVINVPAGSPWDVQAEAMRAKATSARVRDTFIGVECDPAFGLGDPPCSITWSPKV